MTAAPKAVTPDEFLAALPDDRRAALTALHKAIRKAAPRLEPYIDYGMLGYGRYHYKYASGREGVCGIVSLASQKQHIGLYICACDDDGYLVESNKDRLGKVSVGKSCIRFRKLEDLNLKVAMELVKRASALLKKKDGGDFRL